MQSSWINKLSEWHIFLYLFPTSQLENWQHCPQNWVLCPGLFSSLPGCRNIFLCQKCPGNPGLTCVTCVGAFWIPGKTAGSQNSWTGVGEDVLGGSPALGGRSLVGRGGGGREGAESPGPSGCVAGLVWTQTEVEGFGQACLLVGTSLWIFGSLKVPWHEILLFWNKIIYYV